MKRKAAPKEKTPTVNVVGEAEVGVEILAASIKEIAASMKRINESRLNRRALVILIAADTALGRGVVETVLNSMAYLEQRYLKKAS